MLENNYLKIKSKTVGAELSSIFSKIRNRECLWQADPKVWAGQAPLLFPHCGDLADNSLRAKGENYPAERHGFARTSHFELVEESEDKLVYLLKESAETLKKYPYKFELYVEYSLRDNILVQNVRVKNPQDSGEQLPFTFGFHPAFSLPFSQGGKTSDYEIVFDAPETLYICDTPNGLVNGEEELFIENKLSIDLADSMFANGSICLKGFKSSFMTLRNKLGKESIRLGIAGFPQTLLWSMPSNPLPYICIEPWLGLPDNTGETSDFTCKTGTILLTPGEEYEKELTMQFD